MYVGHARVAKGNEVCKRCKVVVFCGTCWLWLLLVLACLYSCPLVFVGGFPDFHWPPFLYYPLLSQCSSITL